MNKIWIVKGNDGVTTDVEAERAVAEGAYTLKFFDAEDNVVAQYNGYNSFSLKPAEVS